jgi:hypothetical protein
MRTVLLRSGVFFVTHGYAETRIANIRKGRLRSTN